MAQSREYELILLGATGYTGKLTAEWIGQHLPTDLKWAIAGRNAKKLQGVVEELKALSPDRKQPGEFLRNFPDLKERSEGCTHKIARNND